MRHGLFLAALTVSTVFVGPASAMTVRRDVPIGDGLTLDVYQEGDTPRPGIIFVHGGGWSAGDKAAARSVAASFVDRGFTLVSVNYRLVPPRRLEQSAQDVADAISFVVHNGKSLRVKLGGVSLVGHSAGAYYAALVATDRRYFDRIELLPSTVKSVTLLDCVSCDLVTEMSRPRGTKRQNIFGSDPARWAAMSPIRYLSKNAPPFLVIYADKAGASKKDALRFCEIARNVGARADCDGFKDITHGQFLTGLKDQSFPVAEPLFRFLTTLTR